MNKHFCSKRIAHLLGVAGFVPFLLLLLGAWLAPPAIVSEFIKAQQGYAMVVLAFVGAIHWGAAAAAAGLSVEQTRAAMLWSVCPALLAWLSTMAGGFGFAVLMAGFLIAYQVDKRLYAWYPLPGRMLRLRLKLTVAVIAALALTVIAGNLRG